MATECPTIRYYLNFYNSADHAPSKHSLLPTSYRIASIGCPLSEILNELCGGLRAETARRKLFSQWRKADGTATGVIMRAMA